MDSSTDYDVIVIGAGHNGLAATALLAAQLLKAEALPSGTHRWELEQGYEMGRPSDLHLEADIADGKLKAVRVAGQAVQMMSGVLEL